MLVTDVHQERGYKVAAGIRSRGGEAHFLKVDVTAEADLIAAVKLAEREFGLLNVVVANAGIAGSGTSKTLEEVTDDEWDHIIDVNLKSVWRTFKATLPALRRAGGGAMTSTASAAGVNISGGMKLGAYTASKWGVVGLTRYFASEVEQDKIRVNCVCPGGMRTNVDESFGYNNAQDLAAAREKRNQMRWMSDPREVAYLHLFLCSHESSFVTGQAILADGGGGLYLNYREGARA